MVYLFANNLKEIFDSIIIEKDNVIVIKGERKQAVPKKIYFKNILF